MLEALKIMQQIGIDYMLEKGMEQELRGKGVRLEATKDQEAL